MNFPDNLKYSSDHEWVRVEGNEAFVGITDFAQDELGEDFDLVGFHRMVLGSGSMPLDILDRVVQEYLAAKK